MCSQFGDHDSKEEVEDLLAVCIAFGQQQRSRRRPAKQTRYQRDVTRRSSEEQHRLQTTGARREISRPEWTTQELDELRRADQTIVPERWCLDKSTIGGHPRLQSL